MLITQSGFRMFSEYDLGGNLDVFGVAMRKEIESDSSAADQDENGYVAARIKKHFVNPLKLHTDKITVTQQEVEISAENFPSGFMTRHHESYPKNVFTFHLPFEGNVDLLRCRPSSFMMWSEEIAISSDNEIEFEVIDFSNDVEKIKKERDGFISNLEKQISNINNQINVYNTDLENNIRESMKRAKEKFKTRADILSQLGNPPKNG